MTSHQDKVNSYLKNLRLENSSKAKKNGGQGKGRSPKSSGISDKSDGDERRGRVVKDKRELPATSSKVKTKEAVPYKIKSNLSRSKRRLSSIDEMPTEVLVKIFRLLTPHDLMTCSCVCQRWMKLAGDDLLWQPLYQRFKLPQPGKPDSVYTTHAGIKWKSAFMERCIQRRNTRLANLLKKKDPYTTLPANIDMMIRKFDVKWNLTITDKNDVEHVFLRSDAFNFNTSLTVRWYSLEFPPAEVAKTLRFTSRVPMLFEKDGSPLLGSPQKTSLLLDIPWTAKQEQNVELDDENLRLQIIHPGVLVATWKDGGGIAFISLCLHKFTLMERMLYGNPASSYQHIHAKPTPDDVDTQYGLHDFQCNIELRQQRALCWSERFTGLHCPKDEIKDGLVKFRLIRYEEQQEHAKLTKKLRLPWKTDMFKGVVLNLCLLDITLFDEFNQPFWYVSHPVRVTKEESNQGSLMYHGEHFDIRYSDQIGHVHFKVVRDEDQGQDLLTTLLISIRVETINSWFSTNYR